MTEAAMSDRQQKRVYNWEKLWPTWNRKTIGPDECRAIVEVACEWYSVPTPEVRFLKGRRGHTWYDPNDHSINLRPRHMNVAVCLHETAHAIHSYVLGDEAHEIHGPEFVAIYINLLTRAEVAAELALTESARACGVAVADLGRHSPRRLRASYRRLVREAEAAREVA